MRHLQQLKYLRSWLTVSVLAVATAASGQGAAKTKSITPAQREFFESKIRPVLIEHCYDCHSDEKGKNKGELTLDTRDGIRAGGDRGPAVVPGKPDESVLINAIRQVGQLRMPPDSRGGPLSESVVADFEKWVAEGAPDPRDAAKVGVVEAAKPEKPVEWDKERQFWAFQKPKAVTPPQVLNTGWAKSPVDQFVLAGLETKGLHPVADADKRTLLRRTYYDLIGLPPSPAEIESFVQDLAPDALEKIVDRLLASPRFGEQWGRYWLDVARYGESTGLDRNLNFPYAWRYRDYVIDAFNHDKPYDRFILEQIAGDQLPFTSEKEHDANLTATGFLAIGPKGLNETRVKYSKWQVVVDQIDATSRGFLGLTAGCAQCHDHKFDPIPQKDYYALAGIFSSTETLYGTVGGRGNRRPTSLLSLAGAPALAVLSTGEPTPNMFVNTNANFNATPRTNGLARRVNGTNGFGGGARRFARNVSTNILERIPATNTYAMGVRDYDEPQAASIYYRGDLTKPRDTVPRGFLRILALPQTPAIPTNASGRLQLAQWITDPENPLTARVAVNRVWQHLFGEGIVATPDNFGHLGTAPTHPELLDYLAAKFATEQKWSFKQLVRSLVLTRAYQLSSEIDAKAAEADPENRLLWRATPRRLKAEQLRDSILTSSGRLDLNPPAFPDTARFGDGYYGVNIWESDLPQHFYSRSVYLPVPRDLVPESLSLFDLPNPNLVGAHREETTSPSQALFLMNNAFVQDEALHLARQLASNQDLSDAERIQRAYLAVFQRRPSPDEVQRATRFIQEEAGVLAETKSFKPEQTGLDIQLKPAPEAPAPAGEVAVPQFAKAEPAAPVPAAVVGAPAVADDGTNAPAAGGFNPRGPRRYLGPGSASDVVVGKLAPGIARPKVFQQALPEQPATPEEGAYALFAQALFGSAEFRYLQ